MQYETFKELVLARLAEDIPNPKKITVQKVYRNNGKYLDGLVILENGVNIAPAMYLNYYYRALREGSSFTGVYSQIISQYERNRASKCISTDIFTDFSKMKNHIIMKLINHERNAEFLKDVPHIDYLDLSIVFICMFHIDSDIGNASIIIRNATMTLWQQDSSSLFELSKANTERLLPPKLKHMNSILEDLDSLPDYPAVPVQDDPLYPMYVLTNDQDFFGASAMVFSDLIRSYAERFKADFYILPSSIHEVILVPAGDDSRLDDFSHMVAEVNESQVADEDILADHAYYYSRDTGTIIY